MNNVKLQVVCLTYNHAKFIRQALDGFVMQTTNFPFEVLIGDDASTDGTPDIIREYAEKYPDIIKPILRKKNIGAQQNSVDLLKRVNAKYLALCEGDDYWTDPNKLQIQVDYLDSHLDCNGCWHDTEIKKEPDIKEWNSDFYFIPDKKGRQFWPNSIAHFNKHKTQYTLSDILDGPIATASVVYRYPEKMEYPEWFAHAIAGDRAMHAFMIKNKYFAYINKTMSVYRVSRTGAWFTKNSNTNPTNEITDWINFIKNINKTLGTEYNLIFQEYIEAFFAEHLDKAFDRQDYDLVKYIMTVQPKLFMTRVSNYKKQKKFAHKIFKTPYLSIVSNGVNAKLYLFGIRILKLKRYRHEK